MASSSGAMSLRIVLTALCSLLFATASAQKTSLIPAWSVQSSAKTGNNVAELSSSDLDTSNWYHIGSHGTLMATLLENEVYTEEDLFFSDNLKKVDDSQFRVPWYYRSDIQLPEPSNGSFFQLQTHGISSRADIWLNGLQVADKNIQAGAYAGQAYDITNQTRNGINSILVRVYPTDYNRDLALGFVDWNPYPPDNGTGIWRDVEIKQTGPVSLTTPRVISTQRLRQATVSIRLDVNNLSNGGTQGEVVCAVLDSQNKALGSSRSEFRMNSKLQQHLTLPNITVSDPQIWWPKQWGSQPLYSTKCTASTGAGVSDSTETKFGIRTVTSRLNEYNDTIFSVNQRPFQIIGGGYTSDIFLRLSPSKLRSQFEYVLDMGLNTIRLEGKQEHPFLYSLADEMGLMLLAGWECCDKWEGWTYNNEGSGITWTAPDYDIANASMRHEAAMMQPHPSMLGFLIGSDFWPDDRATRIYVDALRAHDWDTPIISSASQRGFPAQLGTGGMKMDGPYDWVPPNYWGDDRLGAAFGFASELSSGVGTPPLSSLERFLSPSDMDDLWKNPDKGLYHMSTSTSSFYTRKIYNDALWARYGAPSSLKDYLIKSQMADYEASRAQFEAYAAHWGSYRKATGMIYWMLNNAWPSLHWNLFDYYLYPCASYFGAKVGSRKEHVMLDFTRTSVWLINRAIDKAGMRTVDVDLMGLDGKELWKDSIDVSVDPNSSRWVSQLPLYSLEEAVLVKLRLHDRKNTISRNVYWVPKDMDEMDWDASTWYHTPVTAYANFTALTPSPSNSSSRTLAWANVTVTPSPPPGIVSTRYMTLENKASVPAIFIRLHLVDSAGNPILPVKWSENYITLFPGEKMQVWVEYAGAKEGQKARVVFDGRNVPEGSVGLV